METKKNSDSGICVKCIFTFIISLVLAALFVLAIYRIAICFSQPAVKYFTTVWKENHLSDILTHIHAK